MILYNEAKAIIQNAGKALGSKTETIVLQESVGRVCAQNIKAPIDIQPFDNSAMDGFAVKMADLEGTGCTLTKVGTIAAGADVPRVELQAGQCMEIMTGAPVPPGVDTVIPIELVTVNGDQVTFNTLPAAGANIRHAGEDFKQGMDVLSAQQVIQPQHIMPLATLGIDALQVYKKPRGVFLATGDELVDDLTQSLKPGQIYNSNRPYGLAALEAMGVDCVDAPSMPDNAKQFEEFLENISQQNIDLIISSGAVSAGKFDFIRKGLENIGAEILFHKVKIKPGKPNLFARLPNGTLYFGLPGNPVSTAAGLRFFLQPCLRAMVGLGDEQPVKARVAEPFKKRPEFRMFLKSNAYVDKGGDLTVNFLEGQASFMVRPFLEMNCWAVVEEGIDETKAGDSVDIYPLYPNVGLL